MFTATPSLEQRVDDWIVIRGAQYVDRDRTVDRKGIVLWVDRVALIFFR